MTINSEVFAAMRDPVAMTAAVHRMLVTLSFPKRIAELLMARRAGDMKRVDELLLEMIFDAENEVDSDLRRSSRNGAQT